MCADVIVVGAGLAGMTAALAAEQTGADVILIDRGPIGVGTNSALSNAAFSGPISAERAEEYVDLVLQIGKRLNRVAYVRRVAREAPAAVAVLESLGLEIGRTPGQWMVRSAQPEQIPGVSLVRRVAALVARRDRIRPERGVYVADTAEEPGAHRGRPGCGPRRERARHSSAGRHPGLRRGGRHLREA